MVQANILNEFIQLKIQQYMYSSSVVTGSYFFPNELSLFQRILLIQITNGLNFQKNNSIPSLFSF